MTVSLGLLSLVHARRGDHLSNIHCLTGILRHHPFVQDFWSRLGEAYLAAEDTDLAQLPLSSRHRTLCAAFCLIRSVVLLRTVEKSVKGFVKAGNLNKQAADSAKMDALKLKLELTDRIQLFATMDVYNRQQQQQKEEEFEDLGRSVRMKALESSYEGAEEKEGGAQECDLAVKAVSEFENEWFGFLEE